MSFVHDGYEIFHDLVDRQIVDRVNEATGRACQLFRDGDPYCIEHGVSIGSYTRSRPDRNPGIDADAVEREPYIIGSIAGLDVDFRRLLSQESLWTLAARLLETHSNDVAYHFSSINRKPAMVGPGVGWHRDYTNEYVSMVGPFFLRLMIPLDEMNELNAGIGVVPGSHAIGDEEASRCSDIQENSARAIYPNLVPGDVLAVHSKLVHGGGPNRSEYDRQLMVVQFGRRSASMFHFSAESEYLTLCQRSEMAAAKGLPRMNMDAPRLS